MGGFCLTYETSWYLQWFTRYRWKHLLIIFQQNWLLSPTSRSKELESKICSTIHVHYHLLLFLGLIFMQNKCSCILIWEHFVNSNFCQKGNWRQNSNFQKYCQNCFHLYLVNHWRYYDISYVKQNPPMWRLIG